MRRAAIDIGSNSILLTVVDTDGRVVTDRATVVGLGQGLGDRGLFRPDRMEAAEAALREYVAEARRLGVQPWAIAAVATSAARRSMNASTFFTRLQRDLGLKVRVVSGDEEARLTWLGALRDLDPPDGPLLVVDLGGGSTEIVIGRDGETVMRASVETGSVRLTEAFLGTGAVDPGALSRARAHVDNLLGSVPFEPAPRAVVGVAGTATTLASMVLGLTTYDAERVHGARLSRSDLATTIDRLLPATPEQRRALVASSPERADHVLAGALILDRVLARARRPAMVVSDRGLRFGLLV
jgi:exopolyphosphatase / guanosine-5'-triphosphate,3'-diphosphate pyrophosphatase